MSEKISLGLDFGTSNSAVGSYEARTLRMYEAMPGQTTQPSAIFIRADGYHSVGTQAIDDFLHPERHSEVFHFIPTVKPGLPVEFFEGDSLPIRKLGEGGVRKSRFFPIEELASFVISDLKHKAELQSGKTSENVVLGRPVKFSPDIEHDRLAQHRLEEAAKESGFRSIYFMHEPIGAALYYERTQLRDKSSIVFVFDYGGGTLDTSILELRAGQRITPNTLERRVIASHGIEQGGTDLDKAVFDRAFSEYFGRHVYYGEKRLSLPAYIFDDLPEWHLSTNNKQAAIDLLSSLTTDPKCTDRDAVRRLLTIIQDQQVFSFLKVIEQAKIELSAQDSTDINYDYKDIKLRRLLTNEEYDRYITQQRRAIEKCIAECLRLGQITPDDIDVVLRVGGSSTNRFVGKMLQQTFKKVEDTDPMISIAAGLSIASEELFS